MKNFEYAHPKTEVEAIQLLSVQNKSTAVLAGGMDLVALMQSMVVSPDRVVNVGDIDSMRHIERDQNDNLWIGAAVHLDEVLSSTTVDSFPSIKQVIQGISSIQMQSQGTIAGEVLRRPTCWYFRSGADLLANEGRMVVEGDNRYHAILGNRGPAKFVSASRLAPAMISLGAKVRIVGPQSDQEQIIEIASLFKTPEKKGEIETTLAAGQLVTHFILPPTQGKLASAYEVRHGEGPDQPLAAAAVCMNLFHGIVSEASVVLGQVAPTPWIAHEAGMWLIGRPINEETAAVAGHKAVSGALALSGNEYKIELAKVAVKRAILRAVGLETGGFESPSCATEPVNFA